MQQPYKVGLTGGIGSGKSTISHLFQKLGVAIIDADDIVRDIISTDSLIIGEITNVFGNNIIDETGNLDKMKMRDLIYSDIKSKRRLESILHPHVFKSINLEISKITSTYCILSIPLLFETNSQDMVNTILVIDCPIPLQMERVVRRDKVPIHDVSKIIEVQISRTDRLKEANEVIINDGDINELPEKVMKLHIDYTKRAQKHNL